MPSFLITTSGPFVIPPTAINPKITIWGGGGGGGGGSNLMPGSGGDYAGGGGGAGSYIIKKIPVTPQVINIEIGQGGAGGIGQNDMISSTRGESGRATTVTFSDNSRIYALGGDGGGGGLVTDEIVGAWVAVLGAGGVNEEIQLPGANGYTEFGGRGGTGDAFSLGKQYKSGNYGIYKGGRTSPRAGGGGGGGAGFNGNGAEPTVSYNGGNAPANSGAGGSGGTANNPIGGNGGNGGSGGVLIEYN